MSAVLPPCPDAQDAAGVAATELATAKWRPSITRRGATQWANGQGSGLRRSVPMQFMSAAFSLKCQRDPLVPRNQTQAEPGVVHPQVAVVSVQDRVGNNLCDLLRHDADVDLVAPDVAIAI